MRFKAISLITTNSCNYNCSYCYQVKSLNQMDLSLAKKTVLFLPYLADEFFLNFYGGEPLLAINLIKDTLDFLDNRILSSRKTVRYSITTNGSLLTERIIAYLREHRFTVVYSFDGFAQNLQRKSGSFNFHLANLKKLLECSEIDLEINSVFTPETIHHFSNSIKLLLDLGIPRLRFSLSYMKLWDKEAISCFRMELEAVCEHFRRHHIKPSQSPIANFKDIKRRRISCCPAGQERIAITPDGAIWGCPLFPDYFEQFGECEEAQKYLLGRLEELETNPKEILQSISSNYDVLRLDNFSTSKTECFLCPNIGYCSVCPISSSFCGDPLNKIPDYICEIQKIKVATWLKFNKDILESD